MNLASRTLHLFIIATLLISQPFAHAAREKKSSKKPLFSKSSRVSSDAEGAEISEWYGQIVTQVEVTGLKRIEKDAVTAKLFTKPGSEISRDHLRADVQSLFGMGYFDDILVDARRGEKSGTAIVTYQVKERPVVAELEFEGNERVSTDDLKGVVKVKEWSILDINRVKEDVALIQKHYEEKGFYLAKVSYSVQSIKPDEVKLTYKINDYDKVQIKKITFLNNKRFSDSQLKSVFQETREGGLFSFMSGSGNFKEAGFKQDLQRLTYWYLEHGYVKFKYENPVITVSDDKKWLYISIYLDEGESYRMGPTEFSGDLLFPKEVLHEDLTLREGDTFSITKRNLDIQKLTERYQDLGYAFVNVVPKMNIHDDTKLVDIDYGFEKGNLVYFGEINVIGNSKTHDKVIRRELKVHEGELYSGSKLRESRENVERLGFFAPGEVIFNTVTPKGKNDVLNVDITVKERSTGTITLGAGYGSVQGFFFTTQVSEINLMGRGQAISLSAQISRDPLSRSINLGFTEPYTLDTEWSSGFDLFYVTFPIPKKYATRKLGFDLRVGHPVIEYTNLYLTYKNESLRVTEKSDPTIDTSLDEGVLSSLVTSMIRDKRNNRFETTAGNYQSASLETAGVGPLGGDKKFIKWQLNNRYYKRLVGDLVFRNSIEYGQISPAGGNGVPPSERFYLGGPNNLKGYEYFSIGPTQITPTGFIEPQGGLVQMFALFELEYPLIREAGLKTVVFYDAGNAFSSFPGTNGEPFTIRTDAGVGIRWFSPIGPLRFEWGFPFKARPGESSSVFQFFIGPPF